MEPKVLHIVMMGVLAFRVVACARRHDSPGAVPDAARDANDGDDDDGRTIQASGRADASPRNTSQDAMTLADFVLDPVPTFVTVSGPPDHARFLLKNRSAQNRRVRWEGLDFVDASGARRSQVVVRVVLEGHSASGSEVLVAPREEVMATVFFFTDRLPSNPLSRYVFVLRALVDGSPVDGTADVVRGWREPWR